MNSSSAAVSMTAYFNCEQSDQNMLLCFPLASSTTGYDTIGTLEEIYSTTTDEATFDAGQHGPALDFNGYLGEYVSFTKNLDFISNKFSISFWVKQEPWFNSYAPIISFINSEKDAGWIFDVLDKAQKIRFGVTSTNGSIVAPQLPSADSAKFVHIVGTFDGSSVKLYKDGVMYGSTRFVGAYNPDPKVQLRIGLDAFDHAYSWAGKIDDVRIYNRAITENEVRSIYDNSSSISNGLVGYWPFDDSLKDMSGNGNDARLHFQTVSVAFSPDGRMFFSEKRTGEVKIMKNDKVLGQSFVKLPDVYLGDHQGLLGITLDPKFELDRYVYVYSTYKDGRTGQPYNRVVRFTDVMDKGTNMTVILDKIPADPGGYYAGGALAFGSDDKLYVTVGVGESPDLSQNSSSLLGKILRIDRDGTVPHDNPFPGSPIYAVGYKNPYGIAFDKNSSLAISTDNGYANFDEINILKKGGNYGFPDVQVPSLFSISSSHFDLPIRDYYNTIAPTQAMFYTGNKFPDFTGKFVFGSYNKFALHAIAISGNETERTVNELTVFLPRETNSPSSRSTTNAQAIIMPEENIAAVAQSPQGDVYFSGFNIYKLKSIAPGRQQTVFPIKTILSAGTYINEMELLLNEKTLYLHIRNVSSPKNEELSILSLDIPRNLLGGIYSVSDNESAAHQTGNEHKSAIIYHISPSRNGQFTTVSIKMPERMYDYLIEIKGTRVS